MKCSSSSGTFRLLHHQKRLPLQRADQTLRVAHNRNDIVSNAHLLNSRPALRKRDTLSRTTLVWSSDNYFARPASQRENLSSANSVGSRCVRRERRNISSATICLFQNTLHGGIKLLCVAFLPAADNALSSPHQAEPRAKGLKISLCLRCLGTRAPARL